MNAGLQSRGSLQMWGRAYSSNYNASSSLSYPAPFLNYEKHLIPTSHREACELICHYFFTDANVNSSIEVMSTYAITDFTFHKDPKNELRLKWTEIIEDKKFKPHNKEQGIDFYLYGMSGESIFRPFIRFGKCSRCLTEYNFNSPLTKYVFKNLEFKISCKKCKSLQKAVSIRDELITGKEALNKLHIIRWNIFDLEPKVHLFGAKKWKYKIPKYAQADIAKGEKWYLEKTPIEFIEAVQNFKKGRSKEASIELDEDRIMVITRPMPSTPNGEMLGHGLPIAISALRELMYKNTMRRAQSVLLYENIIPFRIFSPAQMSGDPAMQDNAAWVANLQNNYHMYRQNPQHIAISGIPVNITQAGGDAKLLSMFPETMLLNKEIMKATNTPAGLIEGELTFSGGSVALRVFENTLINFISDINAGNNWKIKQISEVIELESVRVSYMPFKTGDDPQIKQLMERAVERHWLSKDDYLKSLGFDIATQERKIADEITKEQIMMTVAQAKAQAKAQKTIEYMMVTNPSSFNNGVPPIPPEQIDMLQQQLAGLPPEQQQAAMQSLGQQNPVAARGLQNRTDLSPQGGINTMMNLAQQSPDIAQQQLQDMSVNNPLQKMILDTVAQAMGMYMPGMANGAMQQTPTPGVDMRPAPQQKPPMREHFK